MLYISKFISHVWHTRSIEMLGNANENTKKAMDSWSMANSCITAKQYEYARNVLHVLAARSPWRPMNCI